jgi:hypothetical protein
LQLANSGSFILQDTSGNNLINVNNSTGITTTKRAQQSAAPVIGVDLVNKTYIDNLANIYLQKTGSQYNINTTFTLTSNGVFVIFNSPTSFAYMTIDDSTGIQTFYHPQSAWVPATLYDLTNKTYVDTAISNINSFWKITGSTLGINGTYQLLSSGSALFQNSSGTSLLTLSGNGCGINNPVITGTTNLFTLFNSLGGNNQILQIDSNGNLQNCPNLSYVYGSSNSTIISTIPTAIGGQQQTLQWTRSSTGGWYLSTAYISKFPQTDINITIPLLYSKYVNISDSQPDLLVLTNTNGGSGQVARLGFIHGASTGVSVIESVVLNSTSTSIDYKTFNNGLYTIWSMFYNTTQAVLKTPQNYLQISDGSLNGIITTVAGLGINVANNYAGFFTSTGLSVYSGGTPIVFQGIQSGLDQIVFQRSSNNCNIKFAVENYISLASGNNNWLSGSLTNDLCMTSTSNNLRFGTNGITRLSVLNSGVIQSKSIFNICSNSPVAVPNNFMGIGSLTIGDTSLNFGGTTGWSTSTSTAGLLFECQTRTEIAIHDSGERVVSFMYYNGDSDNTFYIGRDMSWGTTPVQFQGQFRSVGLNCYVGNTPVNNATQVCFSGINSNDWIGITAGSTHAGAGNSSTSNRVVIGCHNNAFGNGGACVGAHNYNLTAWATLNVAFAMLIYPSDERIKENIITATNSLCYNNIKKLRIIRYNLKTDLEYTKGLITNDKNLLGVVAQEFEQVFPKSTSNMECPQSEEEMKEGKEKEYIKTINTDQLQYTLVGCVQELQKTIEAQQQQIDKVMNVASLQASQIDQLIKHMTDLTNQVNELTKKK